MSLRKASLASCSRPQSASSGAQSWLPRTECSATLTPDMIDPEAFLSDHVRILREGEWMDDDIIRGACPEQVAIPWLPGMLGCQMRILPHNVLGEERHLDWEEALKVRLDRQNPWYRKYFGFAEALVRVSAGSFPVSHAGDLGPTDQADAYQGETEVTSRLEVIPGQDTQAAGVIRNVLNQSELRRKAGDLDSRRFWVRRGEPAGAGKVLVQTRLGAETMAPLVGRYLVIDNRPSSPGLHLPRALLERRCASPQHLKPQHLKMMSL